MDIDYQKLSADLEHSVKRGKGPRVEIYEDDAGRKIRLNPKKIHTVRQLNETLEFVREVITW